MQNKRSINAGLEANSESQLRRMQPVHTDDSHDRTLTVHVRFFLIFFRKKSNRMRADDAKHRYYSNKNCFMAVF